ncbi:MAG TPA: molybdate ABC transporter substrate-binding protein [Candidatus Eisenbacteria bacterium]|nr:molybdate ABC transporter substrate-binding protein [Candidatus Eisenbacteria bacterium]
MTRRVTVLAIALILCACGGQSSGSQPPESNITVFAAASLEPAFDKIGAGLKTTNNIKTTFNYAGTQTLTAQLQQGAQGDVFASADVAHMTSLLDAGLLSAPSKVFAHNQLEIAVAKGNPKHIQTLADLARSGLVLVLADPSVPAGKYAKRALSKAKVTVHPASLELQVTAVLTKVALGEADAGIVYVSDVVTSGKVDGVTIPDEQNVIADYPIAGLKSGTNAAGAHAFIDLVLAPDGQATLKAAGFQGV